MEADRDQRQIKPAIRRALKSDAADLARLRYRFRTGIGGAKNEQPEAESEFVERCAAWMRERLGEQSNWFCLVTEIDGLIAGHVWIEFFDKIPNPYAEREAHAYLTNFYVIDELRGKGIGEGLLKAAMAHCKEREADSIILWATPGGAPLYLRNGFNQNQLLLEHKVR